MTTIPDTEERRQERAVAREHQAERLAAAGVTSVTQLPTLGSALLDEDEEFLARFVCFPSEHTRVAAVLWATHTHLVDCFDNTPRIAFLSPEPASGKSRALEVLELLVPRPVLAVNVTPAYLFRKVSDEAGKPTVLFDEIDTVFGTKAKDHEEVRGLLNAGHRRGAVSGRCVIRGKTVDTEELPAFCAVALAGLGDLPDTVMTRAVVVRMRRRAPTEQVEPFRRRVQEGTATALRDRLATWCESKAEKLQDTYPDMPPGVEDRDADVWEPLLAIANAAGGTWPRRAYVAAVSLVTQAARPATLGIRLLTDLRMVFKSEKFLATTTLLNKLHQIDEAPWGDLRGKPLDARGLARMVRKYEVKPHVNRVDEKTVRGYRRADLEDAWVRYLPPAQDAESETSETSATPSAEENTDWAEEWQS